MFSTVIPNLQLVWDATSLKYLMNCPRSYQYAIIEGWRSSGVDVEFGGFFASATEVFKKERLNGKSKTEASLLAFRYILTATWDPERGPWGGAYEEQWHCTGTEPYRNAKGNRAKCPWAFKGHWHSTSPPGRCLVCGSDVEVQRNWNPGHGTKDRRTLVRLVVGYCDAQPEDDTEGLVPFAFAEGTPAVELSFKMPTPWRVGVSGEPYVLSGHMDSIMRFGDEYFITDNKTTGKFLGQEYYAQFNPNVQVQMYDMVGSILFPDLKLKGVIIEAAQVLKSGFHLGMKPIVHTEVRREEFFGELEWWIKQAERYATDQYWPMNRAACYLCPFKKVCSADPAQRPLILRSDFEKRHWNTMEER